MIEKALLLYRKHREVLLYLIFGVLCTLVNIAAYFVMRRLLPESGLRMAAANTMAWIIAVLFAYSTNRAFVFQSKTKNGEAVREFFSFVAARVFSLVLEMGILYGGVLCLHWDEMVVKVIGNIVVIVVNYLLSKLIIFKRKAP